MHICVACRRLFRDRDDWLSHAAVTGPEHRWEIIELVPADDKRVLVDAIVKARGMCGTVIDVRGKDWEVGKIFDVLHKALDSVEQGERG